MRRTLSSAEHDSSGITRVRELRRERVSPPSLASSWLAAEPADTSVCLVLTYPSKGGTMKTRILGPGLTGVAVIGLALACEKGSPTSAPAASKVRGISASAEASTDEQKVRWDIISIDFSVTPHPVTAGGVVSALANDGSKITLTGSGTFNSGDPEDVTG